MTELTEIVKCGCGTTKDPNGNCDGSHKKLVKNSKTKEENKGC